MEYITIKRFKAKGLDGDFNIPFHTKVECWQGVIHHNKKMVCLVDSENGHQYFARNDDGNGIKRGMLTQEIQKMLSKRDKAYQKRWDKVWDDPIAQQYKREEYDDYWLWNDKFFRANIEDLEHILKEIKNV